MGTIDSSNVHSVSEQEFKKFRLMYVEIDEAGVDVVM
jgi:hypothetical protein